MVSPRVAAPQVYAPRRVVTKSGRGGLPTAGEAAQPPFSASTASVYPRQYSHVT